MKHLIRKVTGTEIHSDNMNSEEGFCLSRSWQLLLKFWRSERRSTQTL